MKNSINLFLSSGKKSAVAAKKLLEQKRDDEDYRSSVISHDIWTNSFETSVPVRRIYDHVHSFLDVCNISDGKAVFGGKTVFLLNEDETKTFYLFGGEAHFAKGTAYKDENGIICESADDMLEKECSPAVDDQMFETMEKLGSSRRVLRGSRPYEQLFRRISRDKAQLRSIVRP